MDFVILGPVSFIISLFYLVIYTIAEEQAVTMDKSCSAKDKGFTLHKGLSYKLQWNGTDPGTMGCVYYFYGSQDLMTKTRSHSICVESEKLHIHRPGIYVKFYDLYNRGTAQVYTFNETAERFCAERFLDIKIYTDNKDDTTYVPERVDTSGSYFVLKITATWDQGGGVMNEEANQSSDTLFKLIGGILGVGVCACVIVIAYRFIRRTKRGRSDDEAGLDEDDSTRRKSSQRRRRGPGRCAIRQAMTLPSRNFGYTPWPAEVPGYSLEPVETPEYTPGTRENPGHLTYIGLSDLHLTVNRSVPRETDPPPSYDETVKLTA